MSLLLLLGGSEVETEPTPVDSGRVAVLQEYAPPQLICIARDPETGAPMARWASDEPAPENVLQGIHLKGQMPGGKKEATGELGRDPRVPWGDLVSFADIEFLLPGRQLVWSGRFTKAPKVDGERVSISGTCSGWQVALESNRAAQAGIIDSDLSKWGEPSTQRRIDLINAGYRPASVSGSVGEQRHSSALPALVIDFSSATSTGASPWQGTELWAYGGGCNIGWIGFDQVGDASTTWFKAAGLSINGGTLAGDGYDQTGNYSGSPESRQQWLKGGPGRKYAFLRAFYTGSYVGQMTNVQRFENVKLIGDHGLPLQGTWPKVGYSKAQILGHFVPLLAPPLTVDPELLDDDGHLIEQAWYDQLPNTVADIVRDVTKTGILDWFVKTRRRFELRWPGTYGRTWYATMSSSSFQEDSQDADRQWEAMWGRYTDVDGTQKTVGPPGSGADYESELLQITDPDHPAVRAEEDRVDLLDLQIISTPQRAIEITAEFLREANELARSGSVVLSDHVMDENGVFWPVAMVAEGDHFVPTDARDRSPRKIVDYDYDDEAKQVACALGAPPEGLKALQERFRATLTPFGLG